MKRLNTAPADPAGDRKKKKYDNEPKADDPVRRCKLCKRSKLKKEFRYWTVQITRRGSRVSEVRRSWTCVECEDAQQRASDIVASTRDTRAQRYTADSAALAVVDVRRLINAVRLPRKAGDVDVVRRDSDPSPPPEPVYDIKGLTAPQAKALRDLLGSFACNEPDPADIHWHTALYAKLASAIGERQRHHYSFTADTERPYNATLRALHCRRS